MLTYKPEEDSLPPEENEVPPEEPKPVPSDDAAVTTAEVVAAPLPPPTNNLDTDDLLVIFSLFKILFYVISIICQSLITNFLLFFFCPLYFGSSYLMIFECLVQGLNSISADASAIEENNALALAIVPSGKCFW